MEFCESKCVLSQGVRAILGTLSMHGDLGNEVCTNPRCDSSIGNPYQCTVIHTCTKPMCSSLTGNLCQCMVTQGMQYTKSCAKPRCDSSTGNPCQCMVIQGMKYICTKQRCNSHIGNPCQCMVIREWGIHVQSQGVTAILGTHVSAWWSREWSIPGSLTACGLVLEVMQKRFKCGCSDIATCDVAIHYSSLRNHQLVPYTTDWTLVFMAS